MRAIATAVPGRATPLGSALRSARVRPAAFTKELPFFGKSWPRGKSARREWTPTRASGARASPHGHAAELSPLPQPFSPGPAGAALKPPSPGSAETEAAAGGGWGTGGQISPALGT